MVAHGWLARSLVVVLGMAGAVGAPACGRLEAQTDLRDRLGDFQAASHWIYDDWPAAKARAAKEKKPLFVVFRCVP